MFKFKGISNEAMKVIPLEEDFFIRAAKKYSEIGINGRDGSLYEELGYSNVVSSMELQILNMVRKDEILDWLHDIGEFEYDGRVTKMRFYDEMQIVRNGAVYTTTANYIRSPFWYSANDQYIDVEDNIDNLGNVYSEPTLYLKGNKNSKVDITVGNVRFLYTFDSDEYVEIDCEEKTEIANGFSKSKNLEIGFEYPRLQPKTNKVIVHSGNVEIKVKRKDRWL